METAGFILIGLGVAIVVFIAIFLIARWYIERKKQRAIAHKDLVERSFTSQQGSVRLFCVNFFDLIFLDQD